MIDIRLLREAFEPTAAALERRGIDRAAVERLRDADVERRRLVVQVDEARAEQNAASRAIGSAGPEERPAMIARAQELKQGVADLEARLAQAEEQLEATLATVPNLAHPDVPDGGEDDGVVLATHGSKPAFAFEARDHVELMEAAGAVEIARARKVSGARFAYLMREGALLEFALVRYALDVAMRHGHVPVVPPALVREEAMYNTGFLPTDEQQLFRMRDDDLYLVGTAEVPLAGLHMDEIVEPDDLPIRYAGFSSAFRREAGTYGRDTHGIIRMHQFDKVELFSFVTPEASWDEHERLLAIERELMDGLGLHYQVVDIAIGDLGAPAARKYDLEVWLPGQGRYRELTSCSNTTDYQARRLRTRIRSEGDNVLVHTLNGTACAIGRTIIALVETHQREDGSVAVPEALQPHLGREVLFTGG